MAGGDDVQEEQEVVQLSAADIKRHEAQFSHSVVQCSHLQLSDCIGEGDYSINVCSACFMYCYNRRKYFVTCACILYCLYLFSDLNQFINLLGCLARLIPNT